MSLITDPASKSNGLAIASLVLSILSVVIGPFGFVPGIICGHLARANDQPSTSGSGLALAGLIIGYVFLVLSVLLILLFTAFVVVASPYAFK